MNDCNESVFDSKDEVCAFFDFLAEGTRSLDREGASTAAEVRNASIVARVKDLRSRRIRRYIHMIYGENMVFRRLTVMKWVLARYQKIVCKASLGPKRTGSNQRRYKQ